ncbi:unnamed protein product [Trichobilharzia regenti]|nr:unnamed protein product [Trichobilharzia regenti]
MTKGSRRGEYREGSMVSSNAYRLSECNSFRGTSSTDRLQAARKAWLCFTRLQEVHTKVNCESVNIGDNDHDSAHLSLVDHDEMRDMPTTAKLNKVSIQLEREVEFKADEVAEDRDTCETVSLIDQRVALLSSGVSVNCS